MAKGRSRQPAPVPVSSRSAVQNSSSPLHQQKQPAQPKKGGKKKAAAQPQPQAAASQRLSEAEYEAALERRRKELHSQLVADEADATLKAIKASEEDAKKSQFLRDLRRAQEQQDNSRAGESYNGSGVHVRAVANTQPAALGLVNRLATPTTNARGGTMVGLGADYRRGNEPWYDWAPAVTCAEVNCVLAEFAAAAGLAA